MKKGFIVFYTSKAGVYKHPNERPKRTTDQKPVEKEGSQAPEEIAYCKKVD
jgi:hypothetical protein